MAEGIGDTDRVKRAAEAEILWRTVMAWGNKAPIVRKHKALAEFKAKEYKIYIIQRWCKYDQHSLGAHRRAANAWSLWCAAQAEPEDPMEPTAIAFPKWLESKKASTSPLALYNHFDWLARVP